MNKTIATIITCITLSANSYSQDVGSWWMYFGFNRVSEKLDVYTEVQYRCHDYGSEIEQLLLRSAVNYRLTKGSWLAVGAAYVGNYDLATDINAPDPEEGRIFQQYILKHSIPRLLFEHRFRLEQRWVDGLYSNRVRYRLFLTVPLGKKEMGPDTWFVGIYDEIFLNTVEDYFDRNRIYGALGYQFNKSTNVQVGMLNQATSDFDKWYFQLALLWNPDLRKNGE